MRRDCNAGARIGERSTATSTAPSTSQRGGGVGCFMTERGGPAAIGEDSDFFEGDMALYVVVQWASSSSSSWRIRRIGGPAEAKLPHTRLSGIKSGEFSKLGSREPCFRWGRSGLVVLMANSAPLWRFVPGARFRIDRSTLSDMDGRIAKIATPPPFSAPRNVPFSTSWDGKGPGAL